MHFAKVVHFVLAVFRLEGKIYHGIRCNSGLDRLGQYNNHQLNINILRDKPDLSVSNSSAVDLLLPEGM